MTMKNSKIRTAAAICLAMWFIVLPGTIYAQTSKTAPHIQASDTILNHFYLHGFTQNSGAVYDLAHFCANQTHAWTSGPELYSYSSYDGIMSGAANADSHFSGDHPEGHYVGVGYSAGGLLTRQIELNHGYWDPSTQHYLEGLVTLDAPNAGADLAGRWEGYLARFILAEAKIDRGAQSFVSYGVYLNLVTAYPLAVALGEAARAGWPFMQDMTPHSIFLTVINTPAVQSVTTSLPRGWSGVYALVVHRRLAANSCYGGDGTAYQAKQDQYQKTIDSARGNAHSHDSKANDDARGGWWHKFTHWPDCVWNRMRAGDWNASADGWEDLNDAWEWGTADRGESDGFISKASCINEAPKIRQVLGQHNHGDLTGSSDGKNAVWDAEHFDLKVPYD
jgi:hypothetical protein